MKHSETDQNKHSHEKADLWLGVTPKEWIISGIAGVTSAAVAAASKVRSSFYDEVKAWPEISGLYEAHQQKLKSINEANAGKTKSWKTHAEAIGEAKAKFGEEIDAVLSQKWDITPRSLKWISRDTIKDLTFGTYQRWKFAGANTENKIVFNAVVGMVIGAAATLSFFNGVASRHKIERIEDAVTQPKSR